MATTTTPDPAPSPEPAAPRPTRPPVTPRLRLLWRIGGALFAAAILVWTTAEFVSLLAHEEETVVSEFAAGDIGALDIGNETGGSLRVVGGDVDSVRVTAHVSHGWRDTTNSARVEDGRLLLRASCPILLASHCSVGYTVEVPSDLDVRLRGDGRITLTDLDGAVDVGTDNGAVVAERIRGDAVLESDNGRVIGRALASPSVEANSDNGRVELSFDAAPDAVTARSDNGDVEVVVPPGDPYRVHTDTDNGSASATVDQVRASDRTITATTDNGDITIRYAD